jgi:hypothetical protein
MPKMVQNKKIEAVLTDNVVSPNSPKLLDYNKRSNSAKII